MDANHIDLVKFSSPEDPNFVLVVYAIKDMIERHDRRTHVTNSGNFLNSIAEIQLYCTNFCRYEDAFARLE